MTQPVMTLPDGTTLREGDWATLRNGDVVGPLEMPSYWNLHINEHGSTHGYRPNGQWGCNDSFGRQNSHLDIIARATNPNTAVEQPNAKDDTPILWRDMKPEQKGALLLAHHESPGSVEFWNVTYWETLQALGWLDDYAYRIRQEPKRETVTLYGGPATGNTFKTMRSTDAIYRITFDTIDGQPVADSVKLTPI